MARKQEPKIHRWRWDGRPLCGQRSPHGTLVDVEITCRACWRVMASKWGRELPEWMKATKEAG